jgi:hypothetical protein
MRSSAAWASTGPAVQVARATPRNDRRVQTVPDHSRAPQRSLTSATSLPSPPRTARERSPPRRSISPVAQRSTDCDRDTPEFQCSERCSGNPSTGVSRSDPVTGTAAALCAKALVVSHHYRLSLGTSCRRPPTRDRSAYGSCIRADAAATRCCSLAMHGSSDALASFVSMGGATAMPGSGRGLLARDTRSGRPVLLSRRIVPGSPRFSSAAAVGCGRAAQARVPLRWRSVGLDPHACSSSAPSV